MNRFHRGSSPLILISILAFSLLHGCSILMPPGTTTLSSVTTTTGAGSTSGGTPTPPASPAPVTPGQLTGFLAFDQQTGEITGNASEAGNASAVISVELYINGPIGTGTLLTTVAANQTLISGGAADGFTYMPVSAYIDSKPRALYGYMLAPGSVTPTLIGGASVDYFAGPDANGLSYFTANLSSTLSTQCASCHMTQWGNYYTVRALLGSPSPLAGGSPTNNTFYLNASGGLSHPGGDQCSGNSLCTMLKIWYGMDFGN